MHGTFDNGKFILLIKPAVLMPGLLKSLLYGHWYVCVCVHVSTIKAINEWHGLDFVWLVK